MKILYYDCFSGISGDMNLGALVDLGVDQDYLINQLSKLHLDTEYQIMIKKEIKMGISGTKVKVILHHDSHAHDSEDKHGHGSHNHAHSHPHHHPDDHSNQAACSHHHSSQHQIDHHVHRNLKDIEAIIRGSSLDELVKIRSIDMFRRIAQAEAKIHGKPLDEVHFHEVGAIDSIVDIVGAAIALDYLKVDRIMASPVQVGGGFVKCAHGLFPVPAPATTELLKGIPIKSGLVPFETTTPTGAVILAANVQQFTEKMRFSIEKIGYGIGHRDLEIPNVLRVYLGEWEEEIQTDHETKDDQYLLETNIDDMNPELFSYIEEELFKAGALDVFRTPIIMKKGRSAIKLSILVNKMNEYHVQRVVFRETTSLGLRKITVDKIMLRREFITVMTKYGEIRVKNSYYEGKPVKYKAEYDDCKKAAREYGVPIAEIYRQVDQVMAMER